MTELDIVAYRMWILLFKRFDTMFLATASSLEQLFRRSDDHLDLR